MIENSYMVSINGRKVPQKDKVFGINKMAMQMEKERGKESVINATIGALLDDNGELIVFSSVDKAFKDLKPQEYAKYAPIGGTPEFRRAAIDAALGDFSCEDRHVRAVATMGGTGAIRTAISNYSEYGESVLTTDWHWNPYKSITSEQDRNLETFPLFDEERNFNIKAFKMKVADILERQNRLAIILNTPAHNPTGYSINISEWESILNVLEDVRADKKIALIVDAAYIDYAGDEREVRGFIPILMRMPDNVIPFIAYSMSKTYTLYGMRCGALICIAPTEEIADEFVRYSEFSCRASWSNPVRAAQSIVTKIFNDNELREALVVQRTDIRNMLAARGKAFEEAAEKEGVLTEPFSAGFFCSIPHENPEAVAEKLREEGIFVIPLVHGFRVSIASISESVCRSLPRKIKIAMDSV